MKRIGILYGMEQNFPYKLRDKILSMATEDFTCELINVGAVIMNRPLNYDVIVDRISNEVPFYRSVLRLSMLHGAKVINNPFLRCVDDAFFLNSLADKVGIAVPRTAIIPSKEHPTGTSSEALRNLIYPLNWEEIFDYIGFPAFIKPNYTHPTQNEYRVYNQQEFFSAYDMTDSNTMILQECIEYEQFFRCYVVGKKYVRLMPYNPAKPMHLRYSQDGLGISQELKEHIEKICINICRATGFDFNMIEIAVRKGIPIAVDLLKPVPFAEMNIMLEDNFNWFVDSTAKFIVDSSDEIANNYVKYRWSDVFNQNKTEKKVITSDLTPEPLENPKIKKEKTAKKNNSKKIEKRKPGRPPKTEKKLKGRPKGSGKNGTSEKVIETAGSQSPKKRPGRPPKKSE